MKHSAAQIGERLSYDSETGVLRWKTCRVAARVGQVAGTISKANGYVVINIDGKCYSGHRLMWLLCTGEWPKGEIDHVDGNKTNNRIENLRDVTRKINAQNLRRAKRGSATGVLGVRRYGARFIAEITVDGTQRHIGVFPSVDEAHEAYLSEKRAAHAGCTI